MSKRSVQGRLDPKFNDLRLLEELWAYHVLLLKFGFKGDDMFVGDMHDPKLNATTVGVTLRQDGRDIYHISVWPRQGGREFFFKQWEKFVAWTQQFDDGLANPKLSQIWEKSFAKQKAAELAHAMKRKGIEIPDMSMFGIAVKVVKGAVDPWSLPERPETVEAETAKPTLATLDGINKRLTTADAPPFNYTEVANSDTETVVANQPRPVIYPCGCSHLKVGIGMCDVYGPDGQERPETPADEDSSDIGKGPGGTPPGPLAH